MSNPAPPPREELARLRRELEAIPPPPPPPPPHLLALTFTLGSAATLSAIFLYTRYGKRLRNSDWITPDVFAKKRWIKGVVTAVGDGDNFRLYHTPGIGWSWPLKFRRIPSTNKALKDKTLHIRIAGVDAPEGAHFGRPGQPFAEESLAWLRETILNRKVHCQLLRRDQYSRVVANVALSPKILPGALVSGKNLSVEMLRAGWGTVYEQAGAEYGEQGKEEFLRLEAEAKRSKRGMWKHGRTAETPAEYKRRITSSQSLEETQKRTKNVSVKGWFRRLLRL